MKPLGTHNYFMYITTNKSKRTLYTGVTNSLRTRMNQHRDEALGEKKTFAGRYNCYYLIYYERHEDIKAAIAREKEVKGWKREKKIQLINGFNPEWRFLNDEV